MASQQNQDDLDQLLSQLQLVDEPEKKQDNAIEVVLPSDFFSNVGEPDYSVGEYAQQVLSSFLSSRAETQLAGYEGVNTLIAGESQNKFAQEREWWQNAVPSVPGLEQSLPGKISSAFGSALGFMEASIAAGTAGFATGGPAGAVAATTAATGAMGAGGYAQQRWEEAKQRGASDEDAWNSYLLGLPIGALEGLPIGVGRAAKRLVALDKATGGALRTMPWQQVVKLAAWEGIEEGFQEGSSDILGQVADVAMGYRESGQYDFGQTAEAAALGGLVGTTISSASVKAEIVSEVARLQKEQEAKAIKEKLDYESPLAARDRLSGERVAAFNQRLEQTRQLVQQGEAALVEMEASAAAEAAKAPPEGEVTPTAEVAPAEGAPAEVAPIEVAPIEVAPTEGAPAVTSEETVAPEEVAPKPTLDESRAQLELLRKNLAVMEQQALELETVEDVRGKERMVGPYGEARAKAILAGELEAFEAETAGGATRTLNEQEQADLQGFLKDVATDPVTKDAYPEIGRARAVVASTAEQENAEETLNRLGYEVMFVDFGNDSTKVRGSFDPKSRRVFLNSRLTAKETVREVARHEAWHAISNGKPELWTKTMEEIRRVSPRLFNAAADYVIKQYTKGMSAEQRTKWIKKNKGIVTEEIGAHSVEWFSGLIDALEAQPSLAVELAQEQPYLFQRMWDWAKTQLNKVGFKLETLSQKEAAALSKIPALSNPALNEALSVNERLEIAHIFMRAFNAAEEGVRTRMLGREQQAQMFLKGTLAKIEDERERKKLEEKLAADEMARAEAVKRKESEAVEEKRSSRVERRRKSVEETTPKGKTWPTLVAVADATSVAEQQEAIKPLLTEGITEEETARLIDTINATVAKYRGEQLSKDEKAAKAAAAKKAAEEEKKEKEREALRARAREKKAAQAEKDKKSEAAYQDKLTQLQAKKPDSGARNLLNSVYENPGDLKLAQANARQFLGPLASEGRVREVVLVAMRAASARRSAEKAQAEARQKAAEEQKKDAAAKLAEQQAAEAKKQQEAAEAATRKLEEQKAQEEKTEEQRAERRSEKLGVFYKYKGRWTYGQLYVGDLIEVQGVGIAKVVAATGSGAGQRIVIAPLSRKEAGKVAVEIEKGTKDWWTKVKFSGLPQTLNMNDEKIVGIVRRRTTEEVYEEDTQKLLDQRLTAIDELERGDQARWSLERDDEAFAPDPSLTGVVAAVSNAVGYLGGSTDMRSVVNKILGVNRLEDAEVVQIPELGDLHVWPDGSMAFNLGNGAVVDVSPQDGGVRIQSLTEAIKKSGDQYTTRRLNYGTWDTRRVRYSLGDGVRVGSLFSGFRTVEANLGYVTSTFVAEHDASIVDAYNEATGRTDAPTDVFSTTAEQLREADVYLFHSSPVCKEFSMAKAGRKPTEIEIKSAKHIAMLIREVKPPAVTVENVPQYRKFPPFQDIVDALKESGYNFEVLTVEASEYGAPMRRERLLVRAVREGELPPMPEKEPAKDWYTTIEDLLPDAPIDLTGPGQDERNRLARAVASGKIDPNKPIIIMGSSGYAGQVNAANSGGPAPVLSANQAVVRIMMPSGEVRRATPRIMARLMGMPDTMRLPKKSTQTAEYYLSKKVLGNGVHGVITEKFIKPLLPTEAVQADERYKPRYSLEPNKDWYSPSAAALESWVNKGQLKQALAHLAKFRGTADELEWINIKQWIADNKLTEDSIVTKQELLDFLAQYGPNIISQPLYYDMPPLEKLSDEKREKYIADLNAATKKDGYKKIKAEPESDSHKFVLTSNIAGYGDYWMWSTFETEDEALEARNKVLNDPESSAFKNLTEAFLVNNPDWVLNWVRRNLDTALFETYRYDTPKAPNYREIVVRSNVNTYSQLALGNWTSHYPQANVMVHLRLEDREIKGLGSAPSLFVLELQSDWHQQGSQLGYRDEVKSFLTGREAKLRANMASAWLRDLGTFEYGRYSLLAAADRQTWSIYDSDSNKGIRKVAEKFHGFTTDDLNEENNQLAVEQLLALQALLTRLAYFTGGYATKQLYELGSFQNGPLNFQYGDFVEQAELNETWFSYFDGLVNEEGDIQQRVDDGLESQSLADKATDKLKTALRLWLDAASSKKSLEALSQYLAARVDKHSVGSNLYNAGDYLLSKVALSISEAIHQAFNKNINNKDGVWLKAKDAYYDLENAKPYSGQKPSVLERPLELLSVGDTYALVDLLMSPRFTGSNYEVLTKAVWNELIELDVDAARTVAMDLLNDFTTNRSIDQLKRDEYFAQTKVNPKIPPNAPYKSSWTKLGLRNALAIAVNEGYQSLSLTHAVTTVKQFGTQSFAWEQVAPNEWKVNANAQVGGFINNIDLETMAAQRFPETKLRGVLVKSLEDVKNLVERNLTNTENPETRERIAKQIWERMVQFPEGGVFQPRAEGQRTYYEKRLVNEGNALFRQYKMKSERMIADMGDPVTVWRITPEAIEAVKKNGTALFSLDPGDTKPEPVKRDRFGRFVSPRTRVKSQAMQLLEERARRNKTRLDELKPAEKKAISGLADKALEEGEGTLTGEVGGLAMSSTDPEVRSFNRAVRQYFRDNPDAVFEDIPRDKEARAVAEEQLKLDFEGTYRNLQKEVQETGGFSEPWKYTAYQRIADQKAAAAMDDFSEAKWTEAVQVQREYQQARSLASANLRIAQDGVISARKRALSHVMAASPRVLRQIKKLKKQLAEANKSEAAKIRAQIKNMEERQAVKVGKFLKKMKGRGGFDLKTLFSLAESNDWVAYHRMLKSLEFEKLKADFEEDPADTAMVEFGRYIIELRIAMSLSGIASQAANIAGNAVNIGFMRPTGMLAEAALNNVFKRADAATLGELRAYTNSWSKVVGRAGRNFMKTLSTEMPSFEADLGESVLEEFHERGNSIPGPIGRLVRFPSLTMLKAFDEFFKTLAGHAEAGSIAYRDARNLGLSGDAAERYVDGQLSSYHSEIWGEALDRAKTSLFQGQIGAPTKAMLQTRNWLDEGTPLLPIGSVFFPYVVTPSQIFKAGLKIPFSPLMTLHRHIMGGREYWKSGQQVTDLANTGLMLGISYGIASMLDDDDDIPVITGTAEITYEDFLRQKRTAPPYSVRIGDEWHAYGRIEPLAVTMATVVDAVRAWKKAGSDSPEASTDAFRIMWESVVGQMRDKTFLKTLGDLMRMMEDSDQVTLARFMRDVFITPMTPALVRGIVSAEDPYERENTVYEQEGKSSWEAAVESLDWVVYPDPDRTDGIPPVRYDIWGRPVQKEGRSYAARLTRLFPVSQELDDISKLDILISRYNDKYDNGEYGETAKRFAIRPPPRKVDRNGKKYILTPEEYGRLSREAGQLAASRLELRTLNYENPTPRDYEKITDALSRARKTVTDKILRDRNN
jgi:site-specific DNA-cytosine methylase